jgi:DNA-binding transcriptional ArsR family regulator
MSARVVQGDAPEPDLWRALASPWRRRLLDLLRDAPATTGELASQLPELSRFAVMQHLGVLTDTGVVVVERRGRDRVNHLNPVPLREWYERWVQPMADTGAASLLALKRAAETTAGTAPETGEPVMSELIDQIRTVRLAFELRIEASAQRTFEVMTQQSLDWFPVTYGEDRVRRVVLEPRVGGQHYEDWGDGRGHLYGEVTVYDPPLRWATRGRVMPGTILDTDYRLREEAGAVVVSVTKVATGPMTRRRRGSPGSATSPATPRRSRSSPPAEASVAVISRTVRRSRHREAVPPRAWRRRRAGSR